MTSRQHLSGRTIKGGWTGGRFRVTFDPTLPAQFAADPTVQASFASMAEFGEHIMKQLVPIKSGALYRSLKGKVSLAKGTIAVILQAGGAGVEHWIFVEYGTGQRGARSPQPQGPSGYHSGSAPRGYSWGPSAGMAAQPYMRPAMLQVGKLVI